MQTLIIYFKVIWTICVWCACLCAPYITLYRYGPWWCIGASFLTFAVWLIAGELWVGLYYNGERLYTAMLQMFVFFACFIAILVSLCLLMARLFHFG